MSAEHGVTLEQGSQEYLLHYHQMGTQIAKDFLVNYEAYRPVGALPIEKKDKITYETEMRRVLVTQSGLLATLSVDTVACMAFQDYISSRQAALNLQTIDAEIEQRPFVKKVLHRIFPHPESTQERLAYSSISDHIQAQKIAYSPQGYSTFLDSANELFYRLQTGFLYSLYPNSEEHKAIMESTQHALTVGEGLLDYLNRESKGIAD